MSFVSLPDELLLEIVSYLEAEEILNLILTHKLCHKVLLTHETFLSAKLLQRKPPHVQELLCSLNRVSLRGIIAMRRHVEQAAVLSRLIIRQGVDGPSILPQVLCISFFALISMQETLLERLGRSSFIADVWITQYTIVTQMPREFLTLVCRVDYLLEKILHYSMSANGDELSSSKREKLQDLRFCGETGFAHLAYVLSANSSIVRLLRFKLCRPRWISKTQRSTYINWRCHVELMFFNEGRTSPVSSLTNYSLICEDFKASLVI